MVDLSVQPKIIDTVLRGANMSGAGGEYLDALVPGDKFKLVRDPDNAWDSFATKVIHNGKWVGFLHRDTAQVVAQYMDDGWVYDCEMIAVDDTGKKREHGLRLTPLQREEVPAGMDEDDDEDADEDDDEEISDDEIPF